MSQYGIIVYDRERDAVKAWERYTGDRRSCDILKVYLAEGGKEKNVSPTTLRNSSNNNNAIRRYNIPVQ